MGEDVGGKEAAKSRQRGKVGGRQHGSQLLSHGDDRIHGVYSGISHVISQGHTHRMVHFETELDLVWRSGLGTAVGDMSAETGRCRRR